MYWEYPCCVDQYLKFCFLEMYVKHSIICTVVFLKRLIVPWWLHVRGSNGLKDTTLMFLCVPVTLLWKQTNFSRWSQVIMAVCMKRDVSIQLWEFFNSDIQAKPANSGEKEAWLEVKLLIKSTNGLWKSANGNSGPWHPPSPCAALQLSMEMPQPQRLAEVKEGSN